MTRIHIVVEGQTEEGFVKRVLAPYLGYDRTSVTPLLVPNKPRARRRIHRGGIVTYGPVRHILHRKVTNDTRAYTTTLFDYYALPDDFPGCGEPDCPSPTNLDSRVSFLERRLAEDVCDGNPRFLPYLQCHEFEALLFSDVRLLDEEIQSLGSHTKSRLSALERINKEFATPEDINDDPETAPSKRLKQLYPGYQKVPFGELIAESIGIEDIRDACPRFDAWVAQLEALEPL